MAYLTAYFFTHCIMRNLLIVLVSGLLLSCSADNDNGFFLRKPLEMIIEEPSDYVGIYLSNPAIYPVTANLTISRSEKYEIESSHSLPTTIAAGQKLLLYKLRVNQPFTIVDDLQPKLSQFPGSLKINETYQYALPCACGISCTVSAASEFVSHKGWAKHAVDFDLPEGSKIHAIRSGIVVDVQVTSSKNCKEYTRECDKYANRIFIASEDGAMIHYLHLQRKGAFVKVGDHVEKYQLIGLSGDTGYTTGPHLHVDVTKLTPELLEVTTPLTFSTNRGVSVLSEGESYFRAGCD